MSEVQFMGENFKLAYERSETLLKGLKLATMDFDSIKPVKKSKPKAKPEPKRQGNKKVNNVFDIANYQIEIGTKFGLWTVSGRVEHERKNYGGKNRNRAMVPVTCECDFESRILYSDLTNGHSPGCRSCRMRDALKKRNEGTSVPV